MYLDFTAYIFIYKYITLFSMNVFYNNTKSNIYFFTRFSPTPIHFSLFPNKKITLVFNKIIVHS